MSDFLGVDDIDSNFSFSTDDRLVVAQALCRRITQPRGGNPWEPDGGYDVRALVADSGPNPSDAQNQIEAECLKDERVQACTCVVTAVTQEAWTIAIKITLATGVTFTFTITVDQVTVTLLGVS